MLSFPYTTALDIQYKNNSTAEMLKRTADSTFYSRKLQLHTK
jgi:hypothetical protein